MFAYRASGSLPHDSYSIYSISGRSDSSGTASTRPHDLVSPAAADSSSLRFESSTSAGWVDVFDRLPGVIGRWFRWARYIRPCVLVPFVLTLCLQLVATFRLVSSSRATPRAAARARVPPSPFKSLHSLSICFSIVRHLQSSVTSVFLGRIRWSRQ